LIQLEDLYQVLFQDLWEFAFPLILKVVLDLVLPNLLFQAN
jgi:hypothetical protein